MKLLYKVFIVPRIPNYYTRFISSNVNQKHITSILKLQMIKTFYMFIENKFIVKKTL